MSFAVINPYPQIIGLQGTGLNGGSVYIGVANEDPQINPQPVYWDAALTIPASQPLTTMGGYIIHSGSPANAYCASPYSIRVRDRLGVQLFYDALGGGFSGVSFTLDTVAALRGGVIPSNFAAVQLNGYYAAGDGGAALYKRTVGPAGAGKVQASDASWWIVADIAPVNPKAFGARANGSDDSGFLQSAITFAFNTAELITIDLQGENYSIASALVYPAGANVVLQNGQITALGSFSAADYLVQVTSQSAARCNHDLVFDRIVFDAAHTGGCLRIDNYIRVNVTRCRFFHFSSSGLRLDSTIDSHEGIVSACWAFEYLFGEGGSPTASSVGFDINSNDNQIDSVVSYIVGTGMKLARQYNQVSKAHLGGSVNSLYITANAAFSSFTQGYFDSQRVLIENPWNTEFVGCKFLTDTADASFSFVVLKPLSGGLFLSGLKITNSSFSNNHATNIHAVTVDTSAGSFSAAHVTDCAITQNSFSNVNPSMTRVRTSLYQNASTVWSFDLSDYFPFGAIQYAQSSYFDASAVNPISNISGISSNIITVTNTIAGNGTVYIEADVNINAV